MWSMDSMSDCGRNQCCFKTFNIIEDFNCEVFNTDTVVISRQDYLN